MYKLLRVLLAVLIQRVAAWLLLVTVIRDNDNLVCCGVVFLPLRVRGFLSPLTGRLGVGGDVLKRPAALVHHEVLH